MKNTIIAALIAYVYQSVYVGTSKSALVVGMVLAFWLTRAFLQEIDRKES